jgi:hypothetical protein
MTHTDGRLGTVRFQMILVTFHILEKAMALSTFDRSPIRSTRCISQTKRSAMRASSAVLFDAAISFVTIITIVIVFRHPGMERIAS